MNGYMDCFTLIDNEDFMHPTAAYYATEDEANQAAAKRNDGMLLPRWGVAPARIPRWVAPRVAAAIDARDKPAST